MNLEDRFTGLVLGTAVGDGLGVPFEGMPGAFVRRTRPRPWAHRFVFRRGLVSDDTEHTVFVCQCLIRYGDDLGKFTRRLAWCLRWWFASLPSGIGRATYLSIARLWLGFPPTKSGIFSAGNGPAMRAAPFGAYFSDDPVAMEAFLGAATRMTHSDGKAMVGAMAVARTAAAIIVNDGTKPDMSDFAGSLRTIAGADEEWLVLVEKLAAAAEAAKSVEDFAADIGCAEEVSAYIYHTVPVALYAWYRHHGDFAATIEAVLDCGGDTDTVAAIAGAIAGLTVGEAGIPGTWLDGLWDYPRTKSVLRRVAKAAAKAGQEGGGGQRPVRYPAIFCLPRNLIYLALDVGHVATNRLRWKLLR